MIMWPGLRPGDPDRIGPYQLRGILGAGGMGQVYLGAAADGQLAAVKVIRPELAADAEFRARFSREVSVARQVTSPFTAALLGADADGPMPWLATAYVPGPSLADAVTEHGPLPAASVRELAAGLAAGLSAIHAAGVVHRDLKPSNVLLAPDGPRIIDFGISVAAAASPLTRTGLLIGSPGYMSPEQVEGREVGPASDIFSLGTVLAFAATGDAPFGSGSAPTLAYRAVYQEVDLGRVPAEVRGLIESCLAKDPRRRPTAHELMSGPVTIPPTQRSQPAPPRTLAARPQAAAAYRAAAGLPQPAGPALTVTDLPQPAGPSMTVTSRAEAAGPSMTVTTGRPTPVPAAAPVRAPGAPAAAGGPAAGGRGTRAGRRRPRSLAVTAMIAAVLGASAVGGAALASSGQHGSGGHAMQTAAGHTAARPPVMGQAVMGQAVMGHATTGGMTTPTAAPATSAAGTAPVTATAPASTAPASTAPAAGPSATATAPASPTAAPAAGSSTAPAISPAGASATGSPAAAGAMTPAPAAS
jgi:hypothetical protein